MKHISHFSLFESKIKEAKVSPKSATELKTEFGDIEKDFKNLIDKGYSYYEALELIAQNAGMDPDELESMFPRDTVEIDEKLKEADMSKEYADINDISDAFQAFYGKLNDLSKLKAFGDAEVKTEMKEAMKHLNKAWSLLCDEHGVDYEEVAVKL